MMRWRPWPPLISRKYEVRLTVHRLEGGHWVHEGAEKDNGGLAVEIRWKGPKISLGSFRRTVKRNCTRDEVVKRVDDGPNDGVLVEWDEEFHSVCSLSGYKDNVFHPWEINFTVLHGLNQGAKNKIPIVGSAALNLAEYASKNEDQVIEVKIPLIVSGSVESRPLLCISLGLLELRGAQQTAELVQSPIMPVVPSPSSSGETSSLEKDELSALKAGLRKVKIFTEYVWARRSKKACREEENSVDEFEEGGECDEGKEDSAVRKSFSYGALAYANYADDLVSRIPEQPLIQNSKRSILPWRKRKLSFRSPKAKGEPLLKKAYGEEGGDDIDYDRRQLSSDESLSSARSEQAAGESACTALVAVIADWLQNNRNLMPIKSQFDSLIRDGSLEWRNLCERNLPIWDEISRSGDSENPIFIVSWNDHFFVLKVETDAYYIIDTLGDDCTKDAIRLTY
ncbi:hypothetical protein DH2020_018269 [Rehmannia glutinosa]|uniref:C2 NT-type domain-containing protein n=1 Tax=Rehmannia glutinosa TaxID=99300 RepID=A0ABR0WM03_REHGL